MCTVRGGTCTGTIFIIHVYTGDNIDEEIIIKYHTLTMSYCTMLQSSGKNLTTCLHTYIVY